MPVRRLAVVAGAATCTGLNTGCRQDCFPSITPRAAPPRSAKTSLQQTPVHPSPEPWPELAGVDVRFRGAFAYVAGRLADDDTVSVMRLRYGGSAARWGFAIYLASKDGPATKTPSCPPETWPAPRRCLRHCQRPHLGDPTGWT